MPLKAIEDAIGKIKHTNKVREDNIESRKEVVRSGKLFIGMMENLIKGDNERLKELVEFKKEIKKEVVEDDV